MRRRSLTVYAVALCALLNPSVGIRLEHEHVQYPIGGEIGNGGSPAGLPFSTEKLESYIHDVMERWKAPGMAVAIVHRNEIWAKVRAQLPSRLTPDLVKSQLSDIS